MIVAKQEYGTDLVIVAEQEYDTDLVKRNIVAEILNNDLEKNERVER